MARNEIIIALWTIASLAIGTASIFSEKYRLLIISLFVFFIAIYVLSAYIKRIEEHETKIQKLMEKLKIYEQLINMKADIEYLKRNKR